MAQKMYRRGGGQASEQALQIIALVYAGEIIVKDRFFM